MRQAIDAQADRAVAEPAPDATIGQRKTTAATSAEGIIAPIEIPAPVANGAVRLRHGIIDSPWLRWLALLEERSLPGR